MKIRIVTLLTIALMFITAQLIVPDGYIKSLLKAQIFTQVTEVKEVVTQDKRLNKVLLYKAYWGGFNVASIWVKINSVDEDNNHFTDISANIKTHGLLKMVTKYRSQTSARVIYNDDFTPYKYKTSFGYRKKHRDIVMEFAEDGQSIISEINQPPEKRWKRKEVPVADKNSSYDPLTLTLVARDKIKAIYENGGDRKFSIPLYDGRRRSNQVFTVARNLQAGLIKVILEEKPVSGYTNNELKLFKQGPQIMEIYVSPEDFIPQKAKGESPLGSAWVMLDKVCKSAADCN